MADCVLRYVHRLYRGVRYFQTVRYYGTRVGLTVIYRTLVKKCSLCDTGFRDTNQCLQELGTYLSYTEFHSKRKINVESLFLARQPPVGQGLLIHEVSRSHTTTHHSRQDSSGRVISSSQRPLSDNSQQKNIHAPPVGFEPTISAGERPQTYAIDPLTTGTGKCGK
jgi:hypothetical protein